MEEREDEATRHGEARSCGGLSEREIEGDESSGEGGREGESEPVRGGSEGRGARSVNERWNGMAAWEKGVN